MTPDRPGLWERITSYEALQSAWATVDTNQGSAGGDGVTRAEFVRDLFANLTELRADLLSGTYRTGPFRRVSVPKRKPGYRVLTIPSIRDRVVHTSIARALGPILEAVFEDSSFAYRPNRGVQRAVERIAQWRKRGYGVVIEADIVRFFDSVEHDLLCGKLKAVIADLPGSAPVLALVGQILDAEAGALGTPGVGLVQGSPLSPLLSNLYLDALDEEIEDQGVKLVRFADDFVILCKSERKARKALAHCTAVLAEHGLRLHEDGTRIVTFEDGFDFVGHLFLKTLALKKSADPSLRQPAKPVKSPVTDEGIIEFDSEGSRFDPGHRVLYVLDPAHRLEHRNRSFSVRRDDGSELIAIPHRRIARIEIGPGVAFTKGPIDLAIATGVEIAMVDGYGQTRGIVSRASTRRAGLQFAQARAILDSDFRLAISAALADARLRNQRTQLMRLNRTRGDPDALHALDRIKRQLRRLPHVGSIDEVFGIEGAATADYWPALGRLVADPALQSARRSLPAADPMNASLNYLTGILERDTRAAAAAAGLHIGFAFLHGRRDRHDGLVFDLMEPFRAPLAEGLAVFLFNARRLRTEMFTQESGQEIVIDKAGRDALVKGYEGYAAKRVNRPDGGGKLTWRAMMLFQARALARAVEAGEPALFRPYLMEA